MSSILSRLAGMFQRKGAITYAQLVAPGQPKALPGKPREYVEEGYAQNAIVFRCVDIIAKAVASIPLEVMVGEEVAESHPLAALLKNPNPDQDWRDFAEWFIGYKLLTGTTFAERVMAINGKDPLQLWVWQPYAIKVLDPTNIRSPFPLAYVYQDGRPAHDRRWDVDEFNGQSDLLLWRNFSPMNRWFGSSALAAGARDVDQHNQAGEWNRKMLANNMQPPGMLYTEGNLTEGQFNDIKQQMKERSQGPQNARMPLIGQGGLKWASFANNAQEMDWLNGRRMAGHNIAAVFGVPTQVIPIEGSQTFANYEEARLALWEDTVIPEALNMAGALMRWFRPCYKEGQRLSIKLKLDNVPALAPRRKQKWETIGNATFLSINEKRVALGYEPVKNKEADAVYVEAGKLPLLPGEDGADTGDGVPTKDGVVVPSDGTVQDTAFNGAQVTALISILQAVTGGTLPAASALEAILIAFPTIDRTEAQAMVTPLESFVPDVPEDTNPDQPANDDPALAKSTLAKKLRRMGIGSKAAEEIARNVVHAN